MGVGAGLYMYVVVVQKFTFAISSPDEFLSIFAEELGSGITLEVTANFHIFGTAIKFRDSDLHPSS